MNFFRDILRFMKCNIIFRRKHEKNHINICVIDICSIGYGRNNRRRYYWAEYLVAITYAMVMVIFYRCLTSLAFLISESLSDRMGTFAPIATVVAFTACFRKMMGFGIAKTVWRSVLCLLMYYVFLGLIIAIGIAIFLVYLYHKFE